MANTPSGTVTFLFSDIAGSTRLWESDRAGMESSLAAHDRILRETIAAHLGVVFATGGDSFSAAFPTAAQAVDAAVAAQLGLLEYAWSGPRIAVRMGVHSGSAEERDDNYFGPEVTRAARIMAVGHGGQILLSETAANLVRDQLPEPLTLADLGTHTLKDMGRSEHLFDVRHPDLPVVETPLSTGSNRRANLPAQLTSFVGRSSEVAAVLDLLPSSRLITLTGVGGTGKTRLALEVARQAAADFDDGSWLAELASVTDPELVLTRIADVWGLRPGEGATLIQVVSTYLSSRHLLLVVDNCEHVLDSVSRLLTEILPICPGVTVLATSRESLGIAGETIFQVPSMALPDDTGEALSSDAVALFLERFRASRPGYSPSDDDLAAIVQVCRRLDGIPLGLELAAARLRSMSPIELASRLTESFRILTGASKTALPRQRTLQATIDWSYDLLEPDEKSVFRRLSCFIGGFDLEAAAAVAGGGVLDEWQVIDIVDQLVDKSLLIAKVGTAGTRYRMLEPIRQYAEEEMVDEGESLEAHAAHAAYYADMAARLAPGLRGPDQKQVHGALRVELDNIRAALAELRDAGRADEFLAMCFDLGIFWMQASMQVEGLEVLHSVLDLNPEADGVLRAKGWWVACALAFNLTDPRSIAYGWKAVEAAEEAGDDASVAWALLMTAAATSGTRSRVEAEEPFRRGLELLKKNPGQWWPQEWEEVFAGWLRQFLRFDSREELRADAARSIDKARALGDLYLASGLMSGLFFFREGDDDPVALRYMEEAVDVASDLGFRHQLGHILAYWGWVTRDREGDRVGASAIIEGVEMLAEVGDLPCAIDRTATLISHLASRGQVEDTKPLIAFAVRQARSDPTRFAPEVAIAACQAALAVGDFDRATALVAYLEENAPKLAAGLRSSLTDRLGTEDLLSDSTARGSTLTDHEVLELIGSG